MKLHHSPTSPYARKVMIVLHETGQTGAVTLITGANSPMAPNPLTVAANPLGKIPCLERPEGPAIFDSRVICRYLDSLHHGHKLYPAGPGLWSTLTLEALGDGVLDAGLAAIYETRVHDEGARAQGWIDAQRLKIARACDALEAQWLAHLAGPLDAGAIAVAAALGYVDFRFSDLGWREGRPGLAAWHADFAGRESFKATIPAE